MIDAEHLGTAFGHLGLRPGHHVLVHSSLSSMGHVDGGAATVVRALLDTVGPEGTVLAPTLTGSEHVGPHAEVVFDLAGTPSSTGVIPETVRTWDGAVRSAHPTHSVAAIGAAARRLTEGHEDCVTPCGPGSPYARLAADPAGMILLLGCDHESNTTLHHVEEVAGSDYHLQPAPVRAVLTLPGRTERRDYWVHRYGTPRNFGAIEPLLVQRGLQSTGPVGAATARLMPASGLVSLGVEVLRAAPRYFVRTAAGS
ncbi:aminoglycoside 3-N-acetyltransferase [Actinopolymorpha cephalotaxi]|uniref:Aminoglycoside N(3)-acetyltransferase n=1 Tax=Actinopolymorpha cephalotaxi TaxID=504797 RepID=A0A1I2N6Z8_9ACTN|nr:AAC(3) family N-acetyltransferase [Actinopolymorpha cephalotaxi]NYH85679.1 aminoglycoside 3-N-acetyltransferase [Actinopolymorpha cephalotaxi]SFF98870.1 aminoglycoside 3-N-acetyltransferase [Actinopolymorpha cephalotaxi]